MANIIPAIGTTGLFTLIAPFNTLLTAGVAYTCSAIRRISDIVGEGKDPYALYYKNLEIEVAKYEADVAAGVCIISLSASNGTWVYVPSTYISSYPDMGGVPYTTMLLAANLGAIPNQLDLSHIRTVMSEVILSTLGVAADVKTIAASATINIAQVDHDALEVARKDRVDTTTTDRAQFLKEKQRADQLLAENTELRRYIEQNLK